jgi:hypothetical protein
MATAEQLEAWSLEARKALSDKIGEGAHVIIAVYDSKAERFHMERSGSPVGLIFLWECVRKLFNTLLLPGTSFERKGSG